MGPFLPDSLRASRRSFLKTAGLALGTVSLPCAVTDLLAQRDPLHPMEPASVVPKILLDVRDFGAAGDGKTKDTSVFQQALDRCAVLGGGEVFVPAGHYLIGAIALRSNTMLRLAQGAVLEGSPDLDDYPVTQVRWEGKWIEGHVGLIYAIDAMRVAVGGPGRIVGGTNLGGRPNTQNPLRRPALMEFIRCHHVRLEEFQTSYARMWSVHPVDCEDVLVRGLTIRSTGGNGDGIDADSCRRVWIDQCDISTGDDCISLKSGRGQEGWNLQHPTDDVRITNCTLADSIFACIGIGSETSGGIRNVRIEHCRFTHARTYAVYIKTRLGRGASIENIIADDLDVSGTEGGFLRLNLTSSGLQDEIPVAGTDGIPTTRNFRFSNIHVSECPVLVDGTNIPTEKPLDGFSLIRVRGTCAKGISLAHVRHAEIEDVRVSGHSGPLLQIDDVTGKGLSGAKHLKQPMVARR